MALDLSPPWHSAEVFLQRAVFPAQIDLLCPRLRTAKPAALQMGGIVPHQDFASFIDESGVSQGRFVTVGGICVRRETLLDIHRSMDRFRRERNMNAELKWTKISNQKQEEYEALVDYFFQLNDENSVHFHAVVFDSHKWKNKIYNNGDQDIGISKLFYQLLHHKYCGSCGRHGSLFVCLDHRNSSTPLEDLRRMLNNAARRDHQINDNPFKKIVSGDSKEDDLLQINDVILGAVCAVRNGKHLSPDARASKRAIGTRVLRRSGLQSFDYNSPRAADSPSGIFAPGKMQGPCVYAYSATGCAVPLTSSEFSTQSALLGVS